MPEPKQTEVIDWDVLIPQLKKWSPPITAECLAADLGTYEIAIGYLSLFWPPFFEYNGMVFRGDANAEDCAHIDKWLESTKGDKQRVEATLNHFHIMDCQHPGLWKEVTLPQILFLGHRLKDMWSAKLAKDFPDKNFTVEFFEGTPDKLMDYQITFSQSST